VSDKKIAVMNGANLSHYRADVVSYSDYYPFGAPMTERTAVVTPTDVRYGFNGQESDDEVYGVSGTSYTAEFWQYDSRLGRRWNVDPVGQFNSPYLALADNPIVAIDPSGAWVPVVTETKTVNADKTETKSGYLSAQMEDGDNAETLSKFLSIDIEQATALFNGMGEAKSIAVPEVIAAPINAAIRDSYNPSMNDYKDDWYIADGLETNYNCWESALSISQGQTPDFNNVIEWGGTYAQALRDQTQYENVSENPDAFEFGRTAIRYAVDHERWIGDYNETTHGAIYLGQSKDGTMYVWSKNGKIDAPKIMKQNDVIKMYGKVQGSGPTPNEGGFYNYIGQ
jgi:RHS repeat-associated protein